jgi:outer membrane protein assembly factor BamD (BamD/ComL family)
MARERELLEMARAALGLQRLPEAGAALERHQREFPAGQLAEERESLAVQLLLSQGEVEQARARAGRFHARYPGSIFWPSMEQQLEEAARRREGP